MQIPFLQLIPGGAADEVFAHAERRAYAAGQRLVGELEPGDDLIVLLSGRCEVTVGDDGVPDRLGEIQAGSIVGEIAFLTGALRSATVTAVEPVEALVLRREQVEDLMRRFPQLARHFLSVLSHRLAGADEALAAALDPAAKNTGPLDALQKVDSETRRIAARKRSLGRLLTRAFRELVVEHRRELPFYVLAGFLGAVVVARFSIFALHFAGVELQMLLRAAYVTGLIAILASACAAQFTFDRRLRRVLCLAFGAGAGLLVNELSVLLAFDIFYSDIFHRDPNVKFDPATLYHRSETVWAMSLGLALIVQVTYLRHFYRRAFFILRERWAARRKA
jgi:CRP-like cAMP-binding protein